MNSRSRSTAARWIGTLSVSNALKSGTDYTFVLWNLLRTSGTLIDQSTSPRANITNAMLLFGIRGPADISIEPSIEVVGECGARAARRRHQPIGGRFWTSMSTSS